MMNKEQLKEKLMPKVSSLIWLVKVNKRTDAYINCESALQRKAIMNKEGYEPTIERVILWG